MDYDILFKFAEFPVLSLDCSAKSYARLDLRIVTQDNKVEWLASVPALKKAGKEGFLNSQKKDFVSKFKEDSAKAGEKIVSLAKINIEELSAGELSSLLLRIDSDVNKFFECYLLTEYPFFSKIESLLADELGSHEKVQLVLSGGEIPKGLSKEALNCIQYMLTIQKLKLELRDKYLNIALVGEHCLFSRILTRLVAVTGRSDAPMMTLHEAQCCLADKEVPNVMERQKLCVLYFLDKKPVVLVGKKAEMEIKNTEPAGDIIELKGTPASVGIARGEAVVVQLLDYNKLKQVIDNIKPNTILVADTTGPEFLPLFSKVIGVVADEGGLMSHAALLSREFKIPCIVGTKRATKIFKDGDKIELDGKKGIVRKI